MLLDTHVVLWLLGHPDRIGPVARRSLETTPRRLVSAVSLTEVRIKTMLGKLTVPDDLEARVADHGLETLDLTAAHAAALSALPELARHDPFDRLLLAQAAVEEEPLLTADAHLLDVGGDLVKDARA